MNKELFNAMIKFLHVITNFDKFLLTYSRKNIALLLLLCPMIMCEAAPLLISDGKSDYTIYSGSAATAAEKNAAAELQKYLKLSTGVTLPITDKYRGKKQILVGLLPKTADLLSGIDFGKLSHDEIIICPAGNNLVLAGARPRGSLYAVYTFLEDNMGIRFWTANEQTIPHLKTVKLPEKEFRYAPQIKIRAPYIYDIIHNPAFAAKLKCYGPTYTIPDEWGGSFKLIGPWHTFNSFLPAKQYLKSNPEYFSLRNGKRVGGQYKGQLCLSNPELREKFLSVVLEKLRKYPKAEMISVTQNDNNLYCQCPRCQKVDKAGGGPASSIIHFVNFIAENVEKEFPEVTVQTFAYQYSRHAPVNVKPRHNVSIFLCTMGIDVSRSIDDSSRKENVAFINDIKNWRNIASKIDIWDYIANFSNFLHPHPNLEAIEKNVKFLASMNPHMIMPQGDYLNPGKIGDLQPLKIWILSKLLWNPDLNPNTLEKDFISGYYGAAAPKVEEYIKLRKDAVRHNKKLVGCFMFTTPWLDDKTLLAGLKILDEAKSMVKADPVRFERVEILSKPFEYVLLRRYDRLRATPDCPSHDKITHIAKEYSRFLDKNKVAYLSEETPIGGTKDFCKRMAEGKDVPVKLPPFFSRFRKGQYIIIEENDFTISGGKHFGKVVADPKAANGWAIEMYHKKFSWSIKWAVTPEMLNGTKYDVYGAFRLKKRAKAGLCEFGAWDLGGKEMYLHKPSVNADDVSVNEYSYIRLGTGRLRKKSYLFFAPKVNPQIQSSLLDHLVLVKRY